MADTWLVVGLGNPGAQYVRNRHNVGQMVLDELATRIGGTFRRHTRANAVVSEGFLRPGGPKLVLGKPNSFMNLSGSPTAQLLDFYSLDPSRLIVVHDELDIPFDTLRLKQGGGHGGHNGIRDILAATDGADFLRVRVGIGRPPGRQSAADFVLKDFAGQERDALPILISDAADAVELIAESGLSAAQLKFHTSA
ncbi:MULTISPECIES: aminoacyl-tRNA hydrolase [unclassified Rathayibacter]|uniref:aminoacyl-tRNA hydrolase n=1 Tax=unclassified Rathayibacter TaxID=2609250 RepID=UPI00188B66AB|nr:MULTISPECIES: aminoacyl-tRNA hydrolase [unclassified Rathayibacter]MBF4462802.1 aminoacyl-tRNA hydrolase [Rathayibacter sp. VKM Ac-2879]MBF4504216.1 aminoacyl-tRNA hydrolase [Rathayibacter sp. VKM Ac-2878]